MQRETKSLGDWGEKMVAQMLQGKSFKVLAQNYRTRVGEIDLIAQKDDLVVFVEVKTRKKAYFPTSRVVTFSKQKKLTKTAKYFIVQNKIVDKICRFDIATVVLNGGNYEIDYIENAFYAANWYR